MVLQFFKKVLFFYKTEDYFKNQWCQVLEEPKFFLLAFNDT